jgi:hypothetical protein
MSTAITTEIARIDEYENAEASKQDAVSDHAQSTTTADRTDAEAPAPDAETTPTSDNITEEAANGTPTDENGTNINLENAEVADEAIADTTLTAENGIPTDTLDGEVPEDAATEATDRSISEALAADAETSPTAENGAAIAATEAAINKEISVTNSSTSIMPDEDLVPLDTEPKLPDEDSPVVDPAHALILDDEAVSQSVESMLLDDGLADSADSAMADAAAMANSATQNWQEIQSNTKTFFENVSSSTIAFFKNNRQLWTTLGAIFLAIVSVKLLFAGLDAIEDIPLVAPFLKIIGLVYLVRFGSRYLIRQSDRQELLQKIEHTKTEVLGN